MEWLTAESADDQMIRERDTGFFFKLYEELEMNFENRRMPTVLLELVSFAHKHGFRMIEFDADAEVRDDLSKYEW